MNVPTLPAPATTTRMSVASRGRSRVQVLVEPLERAAAHHHVDDIVLLQHGVRSGHGAFAQAGDRAHAGVPGEVELADLATGPDRGHGTLYEHHLGRRVDPLGVGTVGQDALQHALCGPLRGGDGGYAEPLVDLGPTRVVDAGDHPVHSE